MLLNLCKQSTTCLWSQRSRTNGLTTLSCLFSTFRSKPNMLPSSFYIKFIQNSSSPSFLHITSPARGWSQVVSDRIKSPSTFVRCVHISCVLRSNPAKDERKKIRFTREDYQHFYRKANHKGNNDIMMYGMAIVLLALAASYAAVPIYRIYCQSTGKGGKPSQSGDYLDNKLQTIQKVADRQITVRFNADASSQMSWNFKPTQSEIKVYPGETALAFYTARNPLDVPVRVYSSLFSN